MAGTKKKYGERELDVLIVGGGGAAALAALEVKMAGLTVGLVTKESALVGGATIMAAGGTCAVFSEGDTPGTFQSDILRSGGYLNNEKLVKKVTEGSVGGVLNLETYDFLLDRKDSDTRRRPCLSQGIPGQKGSPRRLSCPLEIIDEKRNSPFPGDSRKQAPCKG
jgi:fumarate reductase (CoM/CoB) subunit A